MTRALLYLILGLILIYNTINITTQLTQSHKECREKKGEKKQDSNGKTFKDRGKETFKPNYS